MFAFLYGFESISPDKFEGERKSGDSCPHERVPYGFCRVSNIKTYFLASDWEAVAPFSYAGPEFFTDYFDWNGTP
jgi:hypothetical protein